MADFLILCHSDPTTDVFFYEIYVVLSDGSYYPVPVRSQSISTGQGQDFVVCNLSQAVLWLSQEVTCLEVPNKKVTLLSHGLSHHIAAVCPGGQGLWCGARVCRAEGTARGHVSSLDNLASS